MLAAASLPPPAPRRQVGCRHMCYVPPWKLALQEKQKQAQGQQPASVSRQAQISKTVANPSPAAVQRALAKAYNFVERSAHKNPSPSDFIQCVRAFEHDDKVLYEMQESLAALEPQKAIPLGEFANLNSFKTALPAWVSLLEGRYDAELATAERRDTRQKSNTKAGRARARKEERGVTASSELIKPQEPNPAVSLTLCFMGLAI